MTHRRRLLWIAAILVAIVGMSIVADVFCITLEGLFVGAVLAIVLEYATMLWCQR